MSTKIGGIYVEVRADKTQFQNDLSAIRSEAKKSGSDIGKALDDGITGTKAQKGISDISTGLLQLSKSASVTDSSFKTTAKSISSGLVSVAAQVGMTDREFASLNEKMLRNQAYHQAQTALKGIANAAGLSAKETKNMAQQMGYSATQATEMANKIHKVRDAGNATMTMFSKFAKAAAVAFATHELVNFAKQIKDVGVAFDSLNRSYEAIMGSQRLADAEMQFVNETAKKLGLNLVSLEDSYKGLLAASKGTTLEGANTRDLFIAVAKASSVLGMSADDTTGSLRAFIQMISKGTVQSEELRGQLGERLYGAFNLAAKAMGTTTEDLNKMLQRGDVLATDLIPKLANVLEGDYSEAAKKAGESSRAAFENFNTAVLELKRTLGESGILEFLANVTRKATKMINTVREAIGSINTEKAKTPLSEYDAALGEANDKFAQFKSLWGNTRELVPDNLKYQFDSLSGSVETLETARDKLARGLQNEQGWEKYRDGMVSTFGGAASEASKASTDLEEKLRKEYAKTTDYRLAEAKKELASYVKIEGAKPEYVAMLKDEIASLEKKANATSISGHKSVTASHNKELEQQVRALEQAQEEQKRALEAFNDDYKKATLSTFEYEVEKLDEMYKEREKLVKAGLITEWQLQEWYADQYDTLYQADVANYYDAQEQKIAAQKKIQEEQLKLEQEAADEAKRISDEAAEAQQEAYDELNDGIYGFTREVIDDVDNMGDTLVQMAEDMVKDIAAAFLTQTIVMPVYMYAANELGMSSLISGASGVSATGSSAGTAVSGAYNAYSAYGSLTGGTADTIAKVLGSEIGSSIGEYIFGAEAWGGYNTIGAAATLPGDAAYEVAANAGGVGTTYSTGMVNSLSAAGAAGIISSLAYTYLGEMLGLSQGEYSGLGAGVGGAAGYTVGASLASGAASGATSGSWAGPVGAIVGAIVGGVGAALLGEDEPDYRIGLFPGNFDWEGSDRMATSENYGYSIATQDYSVKNVESLFSFYDDVFQALDEATTASINDIVAGAQTGDYGRISWFDPSEMSTEDILERMTTDLFRAIREGLVEDIGAGFDADVFTFDFFESIQAEGENLLDTYLGFREAAETLGTGEFLEQFNYQVDTLNVSAAQAYENMKVIAETVYSMTETANALSSTANMTTFDETVNSWQVLIETLERVKATSEQLTEAELARNEVLGSQVTGLTATTIESQILNGGDLNDLVSTQITAIATSSIAETIYAEYIESLNEEAGRVFAESDYDINVLIEYLQGIDTTEAQNKIEELQESFGLLAESANDALDTAEAMRIVTLAIEGQLTVAQKFEEWQIENIEAMNLFSEIAANSVTADELENAVDAFAALGIEGDDLSNVIQDLADTFTEAAQQMYENISDIESAQGDLIGSEESTEAYLNSMKEVVDFFKDTPSLSQIRGDESVTTTEFDEEAYREDIAAAVVKSEYQSILGRNPDSDYWQNELIDGDIVMSSIHDAILAAISEPEDVVEEIYNRLFGRSAESAGLAYWLGALESGALSISDLESALIAGAQGSDIDYYNENKGKVEITNWKDFETAAGLLGLNADNYYNEITSTRTGEFSTSEAEVEAALSLLNDLPDIIDSSDNLISSALDEIANTIGTMDSAVLEDIFGSAASEQINELVSAISNYESSLESDSGTSDGVSGTDSDDTQDQIDAIFAQIQEGIDTINLSDFEKEIYDINKQAQEWTDSLADLGVTASEDLAIIDEWATAQRNALAEGIAEEWQNIINENSLTDADLQLIALDAWFDDQKAAATELGMSLDALTEAYDLQISAIDAARQAEIDSILESASDYLDKSGMSDFESQMVDLENEAASLNEQLTALNATNEELAVITEWLSAKEQELIDARQAEIDAFNDTIQDIISQNTLSDLEYELETLTDWYEEQKESAENLGIALDALNKAYDLQKEAAYDSAVAAARTTYIESLQEEQTILEDTLSLAKENYINGLNDEIDALNETAAEAEKTAESFESLLETIKELKYSAVTDSELNPDKQMAFVGADLAAAMAKIQSGDATEIQAGMEDLPTLTSDFLELSKKTSGSFSAYQNDFAYVMRILNEAEQIAGDQKSTAELSLNELTLQTEALEDTVAAVDDVEDAIGDIEALEESYNAAKAKLDSAWYQAEIDRLTEINNSVLSLGESFALYIASLSNSIASGFNNFQAEYAETNLSLSPGGASVASTPYSSDSISNTNFYNQVVPTAETASDLLYDRAASAFAAGAISSGTYANLVNQADSMGQLGSEDQLILDSYLDRYGFKTGGTVTGPDSGYFMPTTFHGTEHITPDSEMTEVKEVLGEVKDILISIRDTGGNVNKLTIQTNRLLDRVTQGGTEMRVKEIA